MAKVFPDGWRELSATGAAERELQTLAELAAGLGDEYSIYHGVHWTRIDNASHAIFGEIDFAIVGPTGKLLLIEQKCGFLGESAEGLTKRYAGKEKSVAFQMARSADALHARLRQVCAGAPTFVDSLLYCPDYVVRNAGSAGIPPERIVDASRRDFLLPIIRAILPAADATHPVLAAKPKIDRFLADILQLVPEVHALVGESRTLYTRLSGGLAHWARRVDFAPFRLRVIGTAGSGKTQLAMSVYREALAAGRRPLYVCYNRPLADHIAGIVPAGGEVATYHQLGDRLLRSRGEVPDFTRPDAFARIEAALDDDDPAPAAQVDELIVDEGQDMHAGWAANLLRRLRPGGRAWWLEDPLQNLYERPPVELPGWVSLHSDINYRSPRNILDALNRMLRFDPPVQAGSPLGGSEIDLLTYATPAELGARTTAAITGCIGLGFQRRHVAVISYRGREHSQLSPLDRLGPYRLAAPTGRYDLLGMPIRSDGDVLIDSVHRFKGQSSPCVVFTEIDFGELDQRALRRIFVGATRATMRLVLVISERAAAILAGRLSD